MSKETRPPTKTDEYGRIIWRAWRANFGSPAFLLCMGAFVVLVAMGVGSIAISEGFWPAAKVAATWAFLLAGVMLAAAMVRATFFPWSLRQ